MNTATNAVEAITGVEVSTEELLLLLEDSSGPAVAPVVLDSVAPVVSLDAPGDDVLVNLDAISEELNASVVPALIAAAPEPEPAKPAKQLRDPFAPKSVKIAAKLGDKAAEYLVLDLKDAALSDKELEVKRTALLNSVDEMAVKVGEKATMLFGYMRNGGKLNEVMRRTFTVLLRDGELTTGDKGNLVGDLLKKPYSIGTARSQSNQMFSLFPALAIVVKADNGAMKLNPDSTIIAKMKAELGL